MPHDTTKTLFGAPTSVSIGPWVTAKGAGTLVDVGHTKGGVTISASVERHEMEVDDLVVPHRSIPVKGGFEMKFAMAEMDLANLQLAFDQPAANLTGTPPDMTLEVDGNRSGEVYYQLELIGAGLGTTGVRTVTAWRGVVKDVSEIKWSKAEDRIYEVTIALMHEDTGTGADTIMQVVDS